MCVYIRRTIDDMKVHTHPCVINKQPPKNPSRVWIPSADIPVRHSIGNDVCK